MMRIDRAAWARIKERVARHRTASLFKGSGVGATTGVLELMADLYDVNVRPDETYEALAARCARRWSSVTRDARVQFVDGTRYRFTGAKGTRLRSGSPR